MRTPPIPTGLCGAGGCVFVEGHRGIHTWQFEIRFAREQASPKLSARKLTRGR